MHFTHKEHWRVPTDQTATPCQSSGFRGGGWQVGGLLLRLYVVFSDVSEKRTASVFNVTPAIDV